MRKLFFAAAFAAISTSAMAAPTDAGRYQVALGDCEGCHGKNLAGGVVLTTPFGRMVTPNITPDKDTGIGNYTAEDFARAMKAGIAPGGKLLYPAMPYPSYARMSDADIAALWAYMRTVKPVKHQVNVNQLNFPFNLRFMMRGWNMLFFAATPYADNPAKSAALSGASLQGWFAPDLTSDQGAGLGSWSAGDIVEYLQTGRNGHSLASGPMAEAVENSTSKMNDADLKAIAVYLKDLPASRGNGGGASGIEAQMKSGAILYDISCAACHGRDGKGSLIFPPLAGNPNLRQVRADSIVRMVLAGGRGAATAKAPTGQGMPSFAWRLNDSQAADILTYVRNNWGNRAPAVSPETVGRIRSALHSGS